jgi:amino acid transporter
VLSILGGSIFGAHGFGYFMSKLLLLMVLSSAAASTQTTILPTARTTLSMAAFRAIPRVFERIHPRYFSPTWSTVWMGLISAAIYIPMNYYNGGNLIYDAVTAIGVMIAFYYGFTGFACVWYYRSELGRSREDFLLKGLIPFLGGAMLWGGLILTAIQDWKPVNSYVVWYMHFPPHWQIGFAFLLGIGSLVLGLILMMISAARYRPFFRGETLNRDTPIFLADDAPISSLATLPDSGSQEHLVVPPDLIGEPGAPPAHSWHDNEMQD